MEEWKSVVGYEGFYEVSSLGRVRSVDRVFYRGAHKWHYKSKMLRFGVHKCGYYKVSLRNGVSARTFYVHSLVARAFIGEQGDLHVNHKDETTKNNNINNLEYVTCKENINYGTAQARRIKTRYGE